MSYEWVINKAIKFFSYSSLVLVVGMCLHPLFFSVSDVPKQVRNTGRFGAADAFRWMLIAAC